MPDAPPDLLVEGDVFLLSNAPYTVASEPGMEAMDGTPLFAPPGQDLVRLGDGAETVMVGGGRAFLGGQVAFIFAALPTFLRVDRASRIQGPSQAYWRCLKRKRRKGAWAARWSRSASRKFC